VIESVIIRGFKRFGGEGITLDLRGRHVVLAGPNNTGKTTVLQAIAAWGFGLDRWRRLNDYNRRNGWVKVPITRQQFMPVAVRSFDLLWTQRAYQGKFEVVVRGRGWTIGIEFLSDSTEQIYVRPTEGTSDATLREPPVATVFVPAMTGLTVEEPVYQPAKLDQLIGQNRPGEVLRNLLVTAHGREDVWRKLVVTVRELFHVDILPPDATGADIIAEYRQVGSRARYDIASAGSGFQQVLMLLTFLGVRPGSVLLLDEPDAHLHVFLQQTIFQHLRDAAATARSQLVLATHSEVIIDTAEVDELCVLLDRPVPLRKASQVEALKDALRVLDHTDLVNSQVARGILYLEDYTDLLILRAWAKVLRHGAQTLLGPQVYWRKIAADLGPGRAGVRAEDHFAALQLARPGYPGLQLVDGDSRVQGPTDVTYGTNPQKLRWRRYEIESYLLHPTALERFVVDQTGTASPATHVDPLRGKIAELLTDAFVQRPFDAGRPAEAVLENDKARTKLLPPILDAAGLLAFPYTRYHEIAAQMLPAEIHPEVREKLDAICRAFGVDPAAPQP
jgi:predicted ATPase